MKKATVTLLIAMALVSTSTFAGGGRGWNNGGWNNDWNNGGWNRGHSNGGCWGSNCGWALAGAAVVGGLAGAAIANNGWNNGWYSAQPTVVVAPPQMVVVQQPQVVAVQPLTVADRLTRLDFLFNQRLISVDEYQIQRQRIINGL